MLLCPMKGWSLCAFACVHICMLAFHQIITRFHTSEEDQHVHLEDNRIIIQVSDKRAQNLEREKRNKKELDECVGWG